MVLRDLQNHAPILLTGFDPFGGQIVNPSWLAVQGLQGELFDGHEVVVARLPTAFADALPELLSLLRVHSPGLVIAVGQAGGRAALSLERIAINLSDASIADNAGVQPIDEPVLRGGPAAYFSSLPLKTMLRALEQGGIAAEISNSAGTFVCNQVFYGLMHELATNRLLKHCRGGFVHLPFLPQQTPDAPAMPLDDMRQGLRLAVHSALAQA